VRVYLDANILFSAAKKAGAIRMLLHDLRAAGHELVTGPQALAEAERNLGQKAASQEKDWEALRQIIRCLPGAVPDPIPEESRDLLPEKDHPILAEAIASESDILCTGDQRHFGPLMGKPLHGVTPLSPVQTAQKLLTPKPPPRKKK
jgi:predicted nucleic acid-binding protein